MKTEQLERALEIQGLIERLSYKIESLEDTRDNLAMDGTFFIDSKHRNLASFEAPFDLVRGWFKSEIEESMAKIKSLQEEFDGL